MMNEYLNTTKGPLHMPGFIDPDDLTPFWVFWGANVFVPGTVYRVGDIVRPSVDSGFYYVCTASGVAGGVDPVWGSAPLVSGTVEFEARSYDLFVLPGQSIASSVWSASDGVLLIDESISGSATRAVINTVPGGVEAFIITNRVVKDTGEALSRSFRFRVNQQ